MIGVQREAATRADKRRLALAAFAVDGSTGRASLRRIAGINQNERPAALLELVRELGSETVPSLLQDGAIQAPLAGPAPTACQPFDIQIFERNMSEAPGDIQRSAVLPVGSDASEARRNSGHPLPRLAMAPGTSFSSRQNTLRFTLPPVHLGQAGWKAHSLTSAQHEGVSNSPVYADTGLVELCDCRLHHTCEADDPLSATSRDSDILDLTNEVASGSEARHPELWQKDFTPAAIERPRPSVAPLNPKAIALPLASKARKPRTLGEKGGHCSVQVSERRGKDVPRNLRNEVILSAKLRHFALLAGKRWPPPSRALLQSQVVNQPRHTHELLQLRLLFGRGMQIETKGAVQHTASLAHRQGRHHAVAPSTIPNREEGSV